MSVFADNKIRFFNITLLPILFILSYMGQGVLYPVGSTLPKVAFMGFVFFSLYCFIFRQNSDLRLRLYVHLLLFLVLNVFYFFITPGTFNDFYFTLLRTIIYTLISFFPFYYLSRRNKISTLHLKTLFFGLLIFGIINYFNYSRIIEDENTLQNNAVYAIVTLIPFLFLIKNKIVGVIISVLMYLIILSSLKRGAIIIGSVLLLLFYYYTLFVNIKSGNVYKKYLKIFLLMVLFSFLSFYLYEVIISNELLLYRFSNLENDRGSNREEIFLDILSGWLDITNPLHFIFGYGFAGSMRFGFGGTAHNDLLEVVSNFGLVGLFVFVPLWYFIFKCSKSKNISSAHRYILISILVGWVLDSQAQQVYNSLYSFSYFLMLGYIVGINKNNLLQKIKCNHS